MPSTFADVLPIQPLASHQYSIQLADEWCIGTVPNGGYITCAFLIAARTHMQTTHPKRSQPHPINLHLEFFRRTSVGPARFTVKDVKLGSRISNLHLVLSQKQSGQDRYVDEVEGYITMADIATESGLSLPTSYEIYPPALPADLSQLAQDQDRNYTLRSKDPFPSFRRAAQNTLIYLVRPERRPSSKPKSIIDQWIRFKPLHYPGPGRWTNDALGFLVDIFPQIIEGYVNPFVEEAAIGNTSAEELKRIIKDSEPRAKYWYPTLALNLDVKKLLPEDGVEWLFVRVKAKVIRNGRFDLDIEVWDDSNELVATSSHASLAMDASRNITRKGDGDSKKASKL